MWQVYSYDNTASLVGVFNAVAMLCGAGDYRAALAIVGVAGFLIALVAYGLAPQKMAGWQWIASVLLVLSILFIPRGTVVVVDKTAGAGPHAIANVPLGVGVPASVTSSTFNAVTELMETAFQTIPLSAGALPSELTYQNKGLMFGSRMVGAVTAQVFGDPAFRTDLSNFVLNCTAPDLSQAGPGGISPRAFAESDDVWSLMSAPNPARFTSITQHDGQLQPMDCVSAYEQLDQRMPAMRLQSLKWLAVNMHPVLDAASAQAIIGTEVEQAYIRAGIASGSASAESVIQQAALLNVIEDASLLAAAQNGDATAMLMGLSRAQALAQTNATWKSYAKIAEQALPVVRNVIESMLYGMFPVVVMLLLLTHGRETVRAFGNYAEILIWIQLWPPLYAILNYVGTIYAQMDLAASAYTQGGGHGLTLQTRAVLDATALSSQAVVGYLTIAVPMLAWSLLKRMETFGSVMVGGLSALQGTLASSVGGAAVGNVSIGNTALGQVNVTPSMSSPFFSRTQNDASGDWTTRNSVNDVQATERMMNSGTGQVSVTHTFSAEQSEGARKSVRVAENKRESAVRDVVAAASHGLQYLSDHGNDVKQGGGWNDDHIQNVSEDASTLQQLAERHARQWGVSDKVAAELMGKVSAFVGISPKTAAKLLSKVGKGNGGGLPKSVNKLLKIFDGGVEATGGGIATEGGTVSKAWEQVLGSLSTEEFHAMKQIGERVTTGQTATSFINHGESTATKIGSELKEAQARLHASDVELQQASEHADTVSRLEGSTVTASVDLSKDPEQRALFEALNQKSKGPNAQATQLQLLNLITRVQAEPALNARLPERYLDGGKVSGRAALEAKYHAAAGSLPSDAAVKQQAKENDRSVPGAPDIDPKKMAPPKPIVAPKEIAASREKAAAMERGLIKNQQHDGDRILGSGMVKDANQTGEAFRKAVKPSTTPAPPTAPGTGGVAKPKGD